MHFRNSRIRTKVTALLVSLIALWGFAAWVTSREGLNVLWINRLDAGLGQQMEQLVTELQQERRITLVMLGGPGAGGADRSVLTAQRKRSTAAVEAFHRQAVDDGIRQAAGNSVNQRTAEAYRRLLGLENLRKKIDAGQSGRIDASIRFSEAIDFVYQVFDSLATLDDPTIAKDTRTLIEMARARELLSQEDAFAAGALATGRFMEAERVQFSLMVGAQRFLTAKASSALPEEAAASFETVKASEPYRRLQALEDRLIQNRRTDLPAYLGAEQWKAATTAVLSRTDRLIVDAGDSLVERATPVAVGVVIRLALAGGLGLLAVIASIILSITTARDLVRRLEELRAAALELAARRLPAVVERLGRGDEVDVATEAPPLAVGRDAIGQVGEAFNSVQETAIRVAVEQAELRRSYRGILLSLARRTQSLVHRQLTILDSMERRETEPGELADLFRVDHLATRMRRNAENLIVLSGASPARTWRRSVPMVDVVRGALAEIEDYTQVTLMPMGESELAGRAVGDVIHLLAELIENAVSFSPPYAMVQVSGQEVARGYVVEIEDRGLGMSSEDLTSANDRIADPPEFKLTDTPRLGLYVVSRLATRHHIQVTLKASPYGGTTVIVLIPRELISGDLDMDVDMEPLTGAGALPDSPLPALPATPGGGGDTQLFVPSILKVVPPPPEGDGVSTGSLDPPGEAAVPESEETYTPSGLPRRVAQAHIAPELRDEPLISDAEPADDDDGPSPEEIRRLMGSFQSGTERGRSEAARLPHHLEHDAAGEEDPPVPPR